MQPVATRDRGEPGRVDGVEGDVDAVQPRGGQPVRAAGQADAVRGQGDLGPGPQPRRRRDDLFEILGHQRLAAGEPHAGDAEAGDTQTQQADQLVGAQQLLGRKPVESVGRHAVGAPQVAAVGQRDPKILGDPAVPVDERSVDRDGLIRSGRLGGAPTAGPAKWPSCGQPRWSTGTISLPNGNSETGISLRLASASGIPMIVTAIAIADTT